MFYFRDLVMILAACSVIYCSRLPTLEPEFYKSFLEHISAPQRIVAYLCRSKKILHFHQRRMYSVMTTTFNNVSRLPDNIVEMNRIVIIINLTCIYSRDILNQAKDNNMFRRSNVWFMIGDIEQIDPSFFFSIFSQVYLVKRNDFYIEAWKIFKITEFSENFTSKLVYKWSVPEKKDVYKIDGSVRRLTNLMGEPIRVSYSFAFNDSLDHLDDYRNIINDQTTRVNYRLLREICHLFNATYVPIYRKHWGQYNETKQDFAEGMFYDLRHGIADVAGNTATMSMPRLRYFKFLASTGRLEMNTVKWYFRAPSLAYTQNIFKLTFQKTLWIVILASFVAYYVIIVAVAYIEQYLLNRCETNNDSSWFMAFDIVVATVTSRGNSVKISSYSGKIICYCLYVLTLMINISFSAHFFVLLQSSSNDIDSFDKILESGMELGSENISYMTYYLLSPNDRVDESIRQNIYKNKIEGREDQFFLSIPEGLRRIEKGKFAFQFTSTIGYYHMAKLFDEATKRSVKSIDSFINFRFHLAVPKNSSLDDFLTAGYLYLEEAGLIQREKNLVYPQKPMPDLTKPIFCSLDLSDTYLLFFILIFGILLSLFILLLELAISKTTQK